MKNSSRGFTLIELLVVIAIIGILSSVVLSSLSTTRSKGKDASAKGSLSSARNAAEVYYGTGNTYGTAGAGTVTSAGVWAGATGVCTDTDVQRVVASAASNAGNTANCTVGLSGASYEIDVTLSDGTIFCVDSNGFSGKPSGTPTRATTGSVKCQ